MMHDLHKWQCIHGNLKLSCFLTIRVHPVSHFQLFLTCFFQYFFRNPIFIFPLDTQHHNYWRNYDVLPLPYISSVRMYIHHCECMGIFTIRTSFFLSRLVGPTFQRMEVIWNTIVDAWPYSRVLKVGNIYLYSFLLFSGIDYKKIRPGFAPHNFVCRYKQQNSKNILTLNTF
jgi:hypothetical protein